MIRLDIKDYCHDCPNFTPTADVIEGYGVDCYICETTVTCLYHARCESINTYLKRQLEKEKSDK